MKKKSLITILVCALLCVALSIVALADGHDTPIIPIHTVHSSDEPGTVTREPTCTVNGQTTYICKVCKKSYTKTDIPALGHLFSWDNNISEEGIELACSYCGDVETRSAEELETLWNEAYINNAPQRTAIDSSGYLDLDGNGIINAKDYSMIINLG